MGNAYRGSASATGGAGTLTWSATGLPAGVSINAGTGTIKIGNPTLTVIKTNGSYGAVTSSPSGINCGTACSAAFTGGV